MITLLFINYKKAKRKKKSRKTGRQKNRKTERQKDRKTERQKDRKTERLKGWKTGRQKDRKTERQKDRKTERQTNRQTERQNNTRKASWPFNVFTFFIYYHEKCAWSNKSIIQYKKIQTLRDGYIDRNTEEQMERLSESYIQRITDMNIDRDLVNRQKHLSTD